MKVIDLVKTGSIVFAVCIDAVINIILAICPIESRRTQALIAGNTINTFSFILTRIRHAVIDIHFAVGSLKTCIKEGTIIQRTFQKLSPYYYALCKKNNSFLPVVIPFSLISISVCVRATYTLTELNL